MHKPRIILRLVAVLAIAGALAGTASFVAAQQFPQTLPPNTVVGRLGAGQSGPAQAVPMGSLNPLTSRQLFANDFGAVCDGSTDDHVAFQNMINQAALLGGYASRFVGACEWAGTVNFTSGADFGGQTALTGNNSIFVVSGISAIVINTGSTVSLHDFQLTYLSPISTDTAITVTAGTGVTNEMSRIHNLLIGSAGVGIHFIQGADWVVDNSFIEGIVSEGIIVEQTVCGDCGGGIISNTEIIGGTAPIAAIEWRSGGGFHVDNLITNSTAWTTAAIWFNLASGLATSDIWVTHGELEGCANGTNTSDSIRFTRQGSTGSIQNIHLIGNELSTCQNGVNAPNDANGAWLTQVEILGSNITLNGSGAGVGYQFVNSVSGLTVGYGSVDNINGNGSTKVFNLGTQTAANCVAGPVAKVGTFASSTLSSCTSITPN